MLVEVAPGFTGLADVAGGKIGCIANSAMVEEVSMQTSGHLRR